jgi:hypothetical protein
VKIFSLTPHDHRNDFQLAAAVRAVFQVDLEDPLEQLGGGGGAVCEVLAVLAVLAVYPRRVKVCRR